MSCTQSCNQGRNCTCRQACELPEQGQPRAKANLHRIANWLIAILIVVLYAFVQSQDDTNERRSAMADAQDQTARELRRDMAAARMCREQHGPSLVRWTVDGQAACIPLHGKQVAAN